MDLRSLGSGVALDMLTRGSWERVGFVSGEYVRRVEDVDESKEKESIV